MCVCALGLKSLGRSSCTCNSNTACTIVRDPWILSFWSHRILEATFGNWLASRWSNQLLKNSGYSSIFFTFSLSLSRFLSSCLSLSLSLSVSHYLRLYHFKNQSVPKSHSLSATAHIGDISIVSLRILLFESFTSCRMHSLCVGVWLLFVSLFCSILVKNALPRNPLEPVRNPW